MDRAAMRDLLVAGFGKVWEEERTDPVPALDEATVMLDTGLDSLSFAVFIDDLTNELGYDPFAIAPEFEYPQTLGELVDFYLTHTPG